MGSGSGLSLCSWNTSWPTSFTPSPQGPPTLTGEGGGERRHERFLRAWGMGWGEGVTTQLCGPEWFVL